MKTFSRVGGAIDELVTKYGEFWIVAIYAALTSITFCNSATEGVWAMIATGWVWLAVCQRRITDRLLNEKSDLIRELAATKQRGTLRRRAQGFRIN
jgi:hypothetical protein